MRYITKQSPMQKHRGLFHGELRNLGYKYYLNPAFDILKLVHFFAEVKDDLDMAQDGYVSPIEYFMVVYPEDLEVAQMYPDVNEAKGVNIRVYRSAQGSGEG